MAEKTGLGKGLDALFSSNILKCRRRKWYRGVNSKLKLIEVEPNKDQPRMNFDDENIRRLAESIKEYGVIQPI